MYDILYTVKRGPDDNIELRYSLRSLENIPHGNVFIIWHKPSRVKWVIHIPFKDNPKYKAKNVIRKIRAWCVDKRLSDKFIFMCDDFYIKDKVEDVPYYWKWTIAWHIRTREALSAQWQKFFTFKTNIIRNTFRLTDKDFENHFPFIYEKDKYLRMLRTYDFSQGNLYRSAYCKLYNIEWEFHKDCKLSPANVSKRDLNQFTFFSTRNDFANWEWFAEFMDQYFPNKSEYEK